MGTVTVRWAAEEWNIESLLGRAEDISRAFPDLLFSGYLPGSRSTRARPSWISFSTESGQDVDAIALHFEEAIKTEAAKKGIDVAKPFWQVEKAWTRVSERKGDGDDESSETEAD
jgi:hypothetical protein